MIKILFRFKWSILLLLLGVAFEASLVILILTQFRESGTTFSAPGETTVTISKPGDYTLWYISKGVIDGQFVSYPDDVPSGTTIKVFRQSDGTKVDLRTGGSCTMESSGTREVQVGELTFDQPGKYKIAITGLTDKRAFNLDVSKFFKTFLTILGFGLAGGLCLFAGLISGIFALIKVLNRRN
jgi:hypothetical protein